MFKRPVLLGLLVLLVFSGGCWDLREINNSAVSTGAGVELNEEGQILFTTQMVQAISPSESGTENSPATVVTSTGSAVAEAARRQMMFLSRVPEWAHTSTFIIGEKLARDDLSILADFLVRNRNIRPDANLLIAIGTTPQEVFSLPVPLSNNSGRGFREILANQGKQLGIYAPTTVEEFTSKLAAPGIEPAVPQISVETGQSGDKAEDKTNNNNEQNTPRGKAVFSGTAVFKGRHMVGTLNETETRGYRWLNPSKGQNGIIIVNSPLNKKERITLSITSFSSKTRPEFVDGELIMKITVDVELNFYEEDGTGELLTLERIKALEGNADQEIKREIAACITKSQMLQSDIPGWGQAIYRYRPRDWEKLRDDWPDIYPSLASEINVSSKIDNGYLSRKAFHFR